jgi:hypothetical protein
MRAAAGPQTAADGLDGTAGVAAGLGMRSGGAEPRPHQRGIGQETPHRAVGTSTRREAPTGITWVVIHAA